MLLNKDLKKIEYALSIAKQIVSKFTSGRIKAELKADGDPVTAADTEVDKVLRGVLCAESESWLSEETVDDVTRLEKKRVWIVDPLDGTREFVEGIDEWCISIGLFEDGEVVAAGICNPATDQLFLGSRQTGVTLNGQQVKVSNKSDLRGAKILASRSEIKRNEWDRFMDGPFTVIPCGSVAYKLAQVSAGLGDATFTLVPKNEWDIAAGVLLVEAAGGKVMDKEGCRLAFNQQETLVSGLVASGLSLFDQLDDLLGIRGKIKK
ncbi:MAG: 3'(2'),5'-bisphosphate nucleotidase CysQ [Planctomycetota bacterium]